MAKSQIGLPSYKTWYSMKNLLNIFKKMNHNIK